MPVGMFWQIQSDIHNMYVKKKTERKTLCYIYAVFCLALTNTEMFFDN